MTEIATKMATSVDDIDAALQVVYKLTYSNNLMLNMHISSTKI